MIARVYRSDAMQDELGSFTDRVFSAASFQLSVTNVGTVLRDEDDNVLAQYVDGSWWSQGAPFSDVDIYDDAR